jgi:methyl-accepting chemotaxis protein
MKVLMVGGGQASLLLIHYFGHVDYLTLAGVVDPSEGAPGIELARSLSLATYRDLSAVKDLAAIDMIIELTGSAKVRAAILAQLKPHQHFMSSDAARIMRDFIEMQQKQRVAIVEKISEDFRHLAAQLKSSEEHIGLSLQNVSAVIMAMNIITMNARIEAARAGEMGKAFEVVVQAMQGTMGNIQKALDDITEASSQSKQTVADLLGTEQRLKDALSAG